MKNKLVLNEKTKKNIIDDIESLYPADSDYSATREIGKKLLLISVLRTDWRDLPDEVLVNYSSLCEELDRGSGVVKHYVDDFNIEDY